MNTFCVCTGKICEIADLISFIMKNLNLSDGKTLSETKTQGVELHTDSGARSKNLFSMLIYCSQQALLQRKRNSFYN